MENLCQLRINADAALSRDLREHGDNATARELGTVLERFEAKLACVYDEFCGYCAEAEANGIENYPLYHWTKSVIDDPQKQEKHQRSFTIYIKGEAVYPTQNAQGLKDLLDEFATGKNMQIRMVDTDPSKNPQPPAEFRNPSSRPSGGS